MQVRYQAALRPERGKVYQTLFGFRTCRLIFEAKTRQFHSSTEQIAFIPPPCWMPESGSSVRVDVLSTSQEPRAKSLMAGLTQYRNSDCVYSDVWIVTDGSTVLRLLARNLKAITAATTQGIA